MQRNHRAHVHGRGEGIVGRLPLVDVIVLMHQTLHAALAAQQLRRAIGQHLVHVHIGLRAGAGLPHHQREVRIELAVERLVGGLDDGRALFLVEHAQRHIGQRGGLFHLHLRHHHRMRHGLAGEMKVMQAALGLRAP